ncbi:hypothetical protein NDU88_005939 [Pleurodeles waltl]|uniref:Uncharacterized protein n=1 Tax=Pleurodeles waltl TaxID=8319 RepID=A0AAV7UN65_PLEWA|nr:hypothetical protein NDU88_005939 [Pleurodeles waltl]
MRRAGPCPRGDEEPLPPRTPAAGKLDLEEEGSLISAGALAGSRKGTAVQMQPLPRPRRLRPSVLYPTV